jgi:hypothetical protein
MRHLRNLVSKPVLKYVEIHLADHCNLNCKGCGHFSPVASEKFADLKQLSTDLDRLSHLFSNIGQIRLMGGEPLLFPAVTEALQVPRKFFPRADLRIVTNGILLPKMNREFWRALKDNEVCIDLTKYPISLDVDKIRRLAAENGVRVEITECNKFTAGLKMTGDSDPHAAMRRCRSYWYCPFLQEGRLHVCCLPATVHHFNKQFNTSIPEDGGIDIHDSRMSGSFILSLLERPVSTCSFCTADEYVSFDWKVSRKEIAEWEV